jgi:hypothetical protein
MSTIRVQCKPGHLLRKLGPKRLRLVDTDDQILAGLQGRPAAVAQRAAADYFTDAPEEVELITWVERMIRSGALLVVPATAPRMKATPAAGDKPVPLTDK